MRQAAEPVRLALNQTVSIGFCVPPNTQQLAWAQDHWYQINVDNEPLLWPGPLMEDGVVSGMTCWKTPKTIVLPSGTHVLNVKTVNPAIPPSVIYPDGAPASYSEGRPIPPIDVIVAGVVMSGAPPAIQGGRVVR